MHDVFGGLFGGRFVKDKVLAAEEGAEAGDLGDGCVAAEHLVGCAVGWVARQGRSGARRGCARS